MTYPTDYVPDPSEYAPDSVPNIEALREVVEWVEEQDTLPSTERQWKQVVWAQIKPRTYPKEMGEPCGTAFCVAGKVVHDAGYQILYDSETWDAGLCAPPHIEVNYTKYGTITTEERRRITDDPDNYESIEVQAAEILGLTPGEASNLFQATNTAEEIRFLAEFIAGREL